MRDEWNSAQTKYDLAHIRKAEYTYDGYRGLRLSAALTNYTTSGSGQSSRTESYQYEEERDFLTKVQYATNEMAAEYAYDAAGNRTSDSIHSGSWTYDNLNNMLTSPNRWYDEHVPNRYSDPDVMLGRRKWVNYGLTGNFLARYLWDEMGRLTSYTPEASDGGSGAA